MFAPVILDKAASRAPGRTSSHGRMTTGYAAERAAGVVLHR